MSSTSSQLIISGVIDGDLSGGNPKAVELYALSDIADLSAYGIGTANNGGGRDGEEFTFPSDSATAGDYITIATESTGFNDFFGYTPDYTSTAANINGDDAIELFFNNAVVDVFGEIDVDGTGEPWEYTDGWARRIDGSVPSGATFQLTEWVFSGPGALETCTINGSCPVGTFPFQYTSNTATQSVPFKSFTVSDDDHLYSLLFHALALIPQILSVVISNHMICSV